MRFQSLWHWFPPVPPRPAARPFPVGGVMAAPRAPGAAHGGGEDGDSGCGGARAVSNEGESGAPSRGRSAPFSWARMRLAAGRTPGAGPPGSHMGGRGPRAGPAARGPRAAGGAGCVGRGWEGGVWSPGSASCRARVRPRGSARGQSHSGIGSSSAGSRAPPPCARRGLGREAGASGRLPGADWSLLPRLLMCPAAGGSGLGRCGCHSASQTGAGRRAARGRGGAQRGPREKVEGRGVCTPAGGSAGPGRCGSARRSSCLVRRGDQGPNLESCGAWSVGFPARPFTSGPPPPPSSPPPPGVRGTLSHYPLGPDRQFSTARDLFMRTLLWA